MRGETIETIGGITVRRIGETTLLDDAKEYVALGMPKDRDGDPRIAFRGTYDEAAAYAEQNESPDNYESYEIREVA
jgi:hypothetical protein